MAIQEVHAAEVIALARETVGLPEMDGAEITSELIAALLRRAAGILCPCSPATLRGSLMDCLQFLDRGAEPLFGRIDESISGLVVARDLLEIDEVSSYDQSLRSTWVFAAPPSFAVRPNGAIHIAGIAPDQDAFLPSSIESRIRATGATRIIAPGADEDLAAELELHGLHRLSIEAWLKQPQAQDAKELVEEMTTRLMSQPRSGDVEGMEVIANQTVTYYKGRWTQPGDHTGVFVGRRPQEFGNPLWCLVELDKGTARRLLDLPATPSRWRGCDIAWHVQMALDKTNDRPQRYRRRCVDNGVQFDVFSPLPQWAQRRLMTFGQRIPCRKSLASYVVAVPEADAEETFLRDALWLEPINESD